MNRVKFLFVLFLLLQNIAAVKAQGIQIPSKDLLLNQGKLVRQSSESPDKETLFYLDNKLDKHFIQADGNYLLETLMRQIWEESSSSWVNDSLYEYSYNNINLVDTIVAYKWRNGNVWGNDGRWRYIYNSNSKLVQRYNGEWATTYWSEYSRNDYSYSGQNQNLTKISFYWYSSNMWVLEAYDVYSWNTNNYLTNVTSYTLSTIFPWSYYAYWKDEYYYDSTNVLIMKTGLHSFSGSYWTNEINDLYYYDNNGNQVENIRQEWNNTDTTWVNDYRYLYEYDSNNIWISTLYQDWQSDSSNWANVWRETYTYTPQNKIAAMFKETWTPGTGWQNYVLRTYFYDINDNWTEKLTQLWDGTSWKNYYRHLATWLEPVSVDEVQITLNSYYLYNNFPNPFNPNTVISYQLPVSSKVTLKVFDVLGKEVATLVDEYKPAGKYEVGFSGRDLPSGIYFYTLRSGNPSTSSGQVFSETKKMILLK